jgi:hypothetical protein
MVPRLSKDPGAPDRGEETNQSPTSIPLSLCLLIDGREREKSRCCRRRWFDYRKRTLVGWRKRRLVPPFSPLLLSLSNMLSSKNAFVVLAEVKDLPNKINNNMNTIVSELLEVLDDRMHRWSLLLTSLLHFRNVRRELIFWPRLTKHSLLVLFADEGRWSEGTPNEGELVFFKVKNATTSPSLPPSLSGREDDGRWAPRM